MRCCKDDPFEHAFHQLNITSVRQSDGVTHLRALLGRKSPETAINSQSKRWLGKSAPAVPASVHWTLGGNTYTWSDGLPRTSGTNQMQLATYRWVEAMQKLLQGQSMEVEAMHRENLLKMTCSPCAGGTPV
ncbi:hypothetical protein ABBQ38_000758 [Trebouxia sp. C0009 RCD-2024]